MSDLRIILKSAFDERDSAACLYIIEMGLREQGDDFVDWLASAGQSE
jgi:hypothetical protein